jgi:hypothetical protein
LFWVTQCTYNSKIDIMIHTCYFLSTIFCPSFPPKK